jgi:phosphopantetheine adenylyltransferase
MDTSLKIGSYEQHWETVEQIFDENKLKTAMLKALESRFSADLEQQSMETLKVSPEGFEELVGAEFIARSNAHSSYGGNVGGWRE